MLHSEKVAKLQCVVPGCSNPPVAEAHHDRPKAWKSVKLVHVYVYALHVGDADLNRRLQHPRWQQLLFT
jgi:hypothetical protein